MSPSSEHEQNPSGGQPLPRAETADYRLTEAEAEVLDAATQETLAAAGASGGAIGGAVGGAIGGGAAPARSGASSPRAPAT